MNNTKERNTNFWKIMASLILCHCCDKAPNICLHKVAFELF